MRQPKWPSNRQLSEPSPFLMDRTSSTLLGRPLGTPFPSMHPHRIGSRTLQAAGMDPCRGTVLYRRSGRRGRSILESLLDEQARTDWPPRRQGLLTVFGLQEQSPQHGGWHADTFSEGGGK